MKKIHVYMFSWFKIIVQTVRPQGPPVIKKIHVYIYIYSWFKAIVKTVRPQGPPVVNKA